MSNLALVQAMKRREMRHAARERLRERRRVALLRPEARAEYDRAMAAPEPEAVVVEDETWLEALARRLGFDDVA